MKKSHIFWLLFLFFLVAFNVVDYFTWQAGPLAPPRERWDAGLHNSIDFPDPSREFPITIEPDIHFSRSGVSNFVVKFYNTDQYVFNGIPKVECRFMDSQTIELESRVMEQIVAPGTDSEFRVIVLGEDNFYGINVGTEGVCKISFSNINEEEIAFKQFNTMLFN